MLLRTNTPNYKVGMGVGNTNPFEPCLNSVCHFSTSTDSLWGERSPCEALEIYPSKRLWRRVNISSGAVPSYFIALITYCLWARSVKDTSVSISSPFQL